MGKLTKFAIYGLWGERNYELEINDEKLIVVGENGTGKTTVMRILFYCLACRWGNLVDENFKRIEITFDSETKGFEYEQIGKSELYEVSEEWIEKLPMMIRRRIEFNFEQKYRPDELLSIIQSLDLPEEYCVEEIEYLQKCNEKIPESIREITEWIAENLQYQIIFYPTYRRFENNYRQIERMPRRYRDRNYERNVIVSQSGMSDVDNKIKEKIRAIKEEYNRTAAELNLNCFQGILKHDFNNMVEIKEEKADPEYVATVFNSISETNLLEKDILQVKDNLLNILQKGMITEEYDKIVVYFYNMLVQRFEELKLREEILERFFYACNQYLTNKQFEYDSHSFQYSIQIETHMGEKKDMRISQLSSGEKQIVALFCYLYLDESTDKLIIIDEPELSLSVDWQERILEDIVQIPTCKSLIVATQSPFVYDNSLRKYARGIEEFLILE